MKKHQQKHVVLVKCVEDMVRRSIALEIEEHEPAELNRLLEKF